MILEYINTYSAGVIALWATWCILSRKVGDGVLGMIIYAVIALSGYAILARTERIRAHAICLTCAGRCPALVHGHLLAAD